MNKKSDKKGLFIVLDGGEGVGKTTNSAFIKTYLENKGIPFTRTREPGGTPFAEKIRQMVLTETDEKIESVTELLLIFAARCQHLSQRILPAIDLGEWVLCDRFTDATYAYQGGGRGLPKKTIGLLETLIQGELRPDCVIILDAPLNVGYQRIQSRNHLDRMESEPAQFHERVLSTYRERAAQNPEGYRLIDARRPLKNVQTDIARVLDQLVEQWLQHE